MKKVTVNITITRVMNYDSMKSMAADFLRNAVDEAGADDNMKICENLDTKTLSLVQERCKNVDTFSFFSFPDFLEKYGRFINGYDVARVFSEYGCVDKINASIEEIPDEPKEENHDE